MKQVLHNAGVQAFLGWVLTGYLRMALATIRWRHINVEAVEPVLAGDSGAIALFWHGRIPLCLATAPQWWRKRTRAMISPSADGEFIAQALARVGFPAIRMSSAKPGDAAKARQAAIGFREAVTWTEGGGALVITPDGPRGPNEIIAPGALQIAKRSGAPVYLMGIAAAPALQMKTWDKVMWAVPFGRGAVVWDGPYTAPRDIGPAEGEAMLADWSARLSAATRRAEAIVRGEAD